MSAKTIHLTYEGYWREPNISGIPAGAGVYSVYACTHNQDNTVTLQKLIYIGESENVRTRISNHEKWPEWRRHLRMGQQLCFNYAPVPVDRLRAEAALINHHKPPVNTEYVGAFPFPQTTVYTNDRSALLSPVFTVVPTAAHTGLYHYR